ncbi:MAG: D-aminoacyl-tRNA deacylase [Myxococcales bacterium]|nr:D-aminoacyl-tRNA deacylase [Myxococcales bacterium]MDD9971636.1 D-aminoacyl-tRNA deacylase [Myxococcales bacterium]
MRAVVQRVNSAHVDVDGERIGEIGRGLLVYLGVGRNDDGDTSAWMANKVAGLRIFPDAQDRMSLDVRDVGGQVLVISQFTLYADVRRGRRPSFERAGEPESAQAIYEQFCENLRAAGPEVATGRFRAHMRVQGQVDGPVTILVDSNKTF